MGFSGDSPVHHYIAWEAGRPVACSSLYLGAGVAGIYDVATLPEARGRGIGAAITEQPVLVARAQGYDVAILHATPMGDPVYRRLGFRENYRIGFYAWGMTGH
jgi:GNAT superfamily N-acetyltransferase